MVHDRTLIGRELLWPIDIGSPLWVIQNFGAEDELASHVLGCLMHLILSRQRLYGAHNTSCLGQTTWTLL